MPRAPLLSEEQITAALDRVRGWRHANARLEKDFEFADFAHAVAFVDALVAPSDAQDHHPDVAIHWNRVTLSLWTHASGGLTERDFRLAETIDSMTED